MSHTGVRNTVDQAGMIFTLIKDDTTNEYYWITDSLPDQKLKQVFVPLDFDDPAIIQ